MTPTKVYLSEKTAKEYLHPESMFQEPYILETEHLKKIESWKEEEKIWIKQLAEKDAEIDDLKIDIDILKEQLENI